METMQAIGFSEYGPADVLGPVERLRPALNPDTVLIRVAAAGVNPADWVIRSGQLKRFARLTFPHVPGSDVAGVVEAVGPAVTRFQPGERVYAMLPTIRGGGYAEFAAASEAEVARVPDTLSLGEAAAVPLAALTALQALRDRAVVQPGSRVLVYGASGGVGTFGVQIAKAMGAQVTGVSSGRNLDLVRGLGADAVLDYTAKPVTAAAERYDVVFDAVGLVPFSQWRRVLRRGGVAVTVNPILGNPVAQWMSRLRGGPRLTSVFVQPSGSDLELLREWIDAGKVRPVIDQTYPLADVIEAHRYSESKRVRGKLVLIVDEALAQTRGVHAEAAPLQAG